MARIKERDSRVMVEYLLIAGLLELCTERLPLPWLSTLALIRLFLLMKLFPDYHPKVSVVSIFIFLSVSMGAALGDMD